jgi:chromosome segregation ATPase
MFNIFKKNKMKKEQVEQMEQEIVQLRQYVVNLNEDKKALAAQLNAAAERMQALSGMVTSLEEELNYRRAQEQAKNKYNDNSRNY